MAKAIYETTNCEGCDRIIKIQSPPSEDQYREGMIHIRDGTVLLNNLGRPNVAHATSLNGFYCGPACLREKLAEVRKSD